MLLKCPHCDDQANIPNAVSLHENMPIACHACGGFFRVPPLDPDDVAIHHDHANVTSNRQISCTACDISVLIPDADEALVRHHFSCPACHADLPSMPTSSMPTPPAKASSKVKSRTTFSGLAIWIAIGIGIGIGLGLSLSQNMITLDTRPFSAFLHQAEQKAMMLWEQILAYL